MTPENEAALAECIKSAQGPLKVMGGGTRDIGAQVEGEVLSTRALSGVTLYEPGALTLVAGAGTPLAEIEAVLAAEGQRLAFEPMDHRGVLGTTGEPTIGGVVAANVSGPRRIQVGACRDSALGVRFVDGQGRVLKNGGRVMKNVTGYDLVKLMSGSWGTLGVLSEVSLKVQAIPETAACVLLNGLSDADAVKAMSMALGSPYDLTGAAHAPSGVDGHPVTMLRIEGLEESVSYRADKLVELLAPLGAEILVERDADRLKAGWAWVRDAALLHEVEGAIWRISVKPSDAPALVAQLRETSPEVTVLYDWGGGLVWIATPIMRDLRAMPFKGHATLIRGSGTMKGTVPVFHPEPAPLAKITQGLRAKFDPRSILNPGLMG
ncbi:FAD-binding protein [Shimia abyssi]|uniref:Glycolate oxidase FAD binding subunit n=1 Tax=Shimia abyssi TaxID=1662395 RepID=A0A2P8FAA5_9RHOB|nr:FAD-binding protein [Shimia abyssi]PSL18650.1 glycolate oxidase FAD binding subunit [Shimia abyssi]